MLRRTQATAQQRTAAALTLLKEHPRTKAAPPPSVLNPSTLARRADLPVLISIRLWLSRLRAPVLSKHVACGMTNMS
jgi:hypothetical protein